MVPYTTPSEKTISRLFKDTEYRTHDHNLPNDLTGFLRPRQLPIVYQVVQESQEKGLTDANVSAKISQIMTGQWFPCSVVFCAQYISSEGAYQHLQPFQTKLPAQVALGETYLPPFNIVSTFCYEVSTKNRDVSDDGSRQQLRPVRAYFYTSMLKQKASQKSKEGHAFNILFAKPCDIQKCLVKNILKI